MSVLDSIKEKAKADVKHILLPEAHRSGRKDNYR